MQHFTLFKAFSNGGRIEIMDRFVKKSDYEDLLAIALFFAQQGNTVLIPTEVHYKDAKYKQIFGNLIGTVYERKCPDLIIAGEFYEYESFVPPFSKKKISHMLTQGTQQASRVIINNNKDIEDRYILNNILKRLSDKTFKYDIDEVWLYENGDVRLIYKKQ
ncbi:MAG: hypothetical protein LBO74_08130 [Candidatus Symbiothrix sp.]|jgi:hypothetical protein|nr:hypothetical protein [Candidatus Symbiothrix sp.]